ncbi:MAG: glycerophosphodiester phosphodiesterase [Mucilaginibacter polytrichastri]|nr:glycerophosphodiester phosphodiesterase [Mucilaginibacter polytrichastri]
MKKIALSLCALSLCAAVPAQKKMSGKISFPKFDTEAHRGGRGLMPENTIAAMKNAIDLGVTTLEMDLNISKDGQIVVSHDAYFNPLFATTPEGEFLDPKAPKRLLYSMTYDSIAKYDVGLKPHPNFPRQKKIAAKKPLLNDLIDASESYAASKKKTMWYNMEIKSTPNGDGKEHPAPQEFVDKVIGLLKKKNLLSRTIIQSFDVRPLRIIHKDYPDVKLSFLVAKGAENVQAQLDTLGFTPFVYSPEYKTVSAGMVKACHNKQIKIVPWTANTEADIAKLKALKVDGIISDYPDLLVK